ncbi:hypothetical protein GCM10010967_57240 [Dyadobacter beijingensis]|uniref:Transposase n=2 Tax=Dyadobacter beijingensis TaxID=365489 RepID=A0ABQ2IK78_9BACT|nr:hypothetical protein GCM10010967_57240 [Dyadobacter beijingensis]
MEALRAEISVAELCRKPQINESQFYKWIGSPKRQGVSGSWQEAAAAALEDDLTREATTDEVSDLRKENARLKEMVADLFLRYDIVKKV